MTLMEKTLDLPADHEGLWRKLCRYCRRGYFTYTRRKSLRSMSREQLHDIGLRRCDVHQEGRDSLWQR